jgi:hypothetical protein
MPRSMVENIVLPTKIWMKMNKEDFVEIMFTSFNDDTLAMCKQSGMTEDEAYAKMSESSSSLIFLFSNAYEKLKQAGKLG